MKPVDLTTAKALQELGYDGECHLWYNREGKLKPTHLVDDDIPAPRLDDAAYWLRDKKNVQTWIIPHPTEYCAHVAPPFQHYNIGFYPDYDTALEFAVNKAIQIIKDKKQ